MVLYGVQAGTLYELKNDVGGGDEGVSRVGSVVGTVVLVCEVGGRDDSVRSGRNKFSKAPSMVSAISHSRVSDRSATATAGSDKEPEAAGETQHDTTVPKPVAEDAAPAAGITQEERHLAEGSVATQDEARVSDKLAEESGTSSSEAGAGKENGEE